MGIKGLIFSKGRIDTLDRFTDELIAASEKRGLACLALNSGDDAVMIAEKIVNFHMAMDGEVAAILFNNVILSICYDGESLWDRLQIPVYDILVDHPVNYDAHLRNPIGQLHAVLIDRKHEAFVREVYPQVRHTHFVPLGGAEQTGHKPFADREIDVLFTGGGHDERPYPRIPFLPEDGAAMYREVMREMFMNPATVTEEAVRRYVGNAGLELSGQEMLELYDKAYYSCEWNARRHYQLEIMKQLDSAGIPVTIYGGYWQDDLQKFSGSIRIAERVPIEECIRLPGNAKICLNIMPWFKDGAHDRIFDAMINGAVSVTDTSDYLLERFEHGRELVFYELNDLPQLTENIRWLLDNPDQAERIAQRGYMTAVLYDTWEKRLEKLLSFMEGEE